MLHSEIKPKLTLKRPKCGFLELGLALGEGGRILSGEGGPRLGPELPLRGAQPTGGGLPTSGGALGARGTPALPGSLKLLKELKLIQHRYLVPF